MGEGYGRWALGDDAALLAVVGRANVACGFHAGDPLTIDRTVALAAAAGVAVGAHVSYPDLVGFGRRRLVVSGEELRADVAYQLGALDGICRRHGVRVTHVKAHGALYHDLADDAGLADAFADAVLGFGEPLPVLHRAAAATTGSLRARGLEVMAEAFADRAYRADGALVPRTAPGAVLDDPAAVGARAVTLARGEPLDTVDGPPRVIAADTLCVHGDSPGAVALARAVRDALAAAGRLSAPG